MSSVEQVLAKLRRKRGGVTFADFAKGFRLAARVHDLRKAGHVIQTVRDEIEDGFIARYVLEREA